MNPMERVGFIIGCALVGAIALGIIGAIIAGSIKLIGWIL